MLAHLLPQGELGKTMSRWRAIMGSISILLVTVMSFLTTGVRNSDSLVITSSVMHYTSKELQLERLASLGSSTYNEGEEGDNTTCNSAPRLVSLPEKVQVFEIKHGALFFTILIIN